ncbi:hypothetical protein ACFL96_19490 [Thermoproteota archaeon]
MRHLLFNVILHWMVGNFSPRKVCVQRLFFYVDIICLSGIAVPLLAYWTSIIVMIFMGIVWWKILLAYIGFASIAIFIIFPFFYITSGIANFLCIHEDWLIRRFPWLDEEIETAWVLV